MSVPNRYFYHSFPRRSDPVAAEEDGLRILASILESGLLLTPELIPFREGLSDGTPSPTAVIQQKRICFTELADHELGAHSETFGPFSLEWDVATLRGLGACPVFYVPLEAGSEDLSGLGASLLMRLSEAEAVLQRLCELKSAAATLPPNRLLNVTKDGEILWGTQATAGVAGELLQFLEHGSQPVEAILNSLRATSGLFYPTENLDYTGELGYYRQREWRLIGNMLQHNWAISGPPTEDEVSRLLELDEAFFGRELRFRSGPKRRVEECQFVRMHLGEPVFASVRRVVAPERVVDEAKELLVADGWSTPVVSLADIASSDASSG